MDMVEAAKETLERAVALGYADCSSDIPELDYDHVKGMVEKMEAGEVAGPNAMSPAKMGRWFGWLQASCVFGTLGALSLEDCKAINRKHACDAPRDAVLAKAREGLSAMIVEWDRMTRYGSPMAKAANENLKIARDALAALDAALTKDELHPR